VGEVIYIPTALRQNLINLINPEMVQAVQGLGSAVEDSRAGMAGFLGGFESFAFLWQRDIATEHAKFLAGNPKLEVCAGTFHSIKIRYIGCDRRLPVAAIAVQLQNATRSDIQIEGTSPESKQSNLSKEPNGACPLRVLMMYSLHTCFAPMEGTREAGEHHSTHLKASLLRFSSDGKS